MTSKIDEVIVLYNPVSTGSSAENAKQLVEQLKNISKELNVHLKKTEYAGHAEELAKEYAKSKKTVLLVSSSGDGGYNELINGALSIKPNNIYTSLLPSGNANDHYNFIGTDSLVEHIVSGKSKRIDVLKVTSRIAGKPWVRYAHSYVGIGLTPVIGKELTKEKLNFFNEKWLTLKYLFKFHHVTIIRKDKKIRYSSLIFSNINQMSKVIQLSKNASINDGKFEVNAIRHRSKFYLIMQLFRAATIGLEENSSLDMYEFKTLKKALIQLDGEDFTLDGKAIVKIESVHKALEIIT
jgi:diacylglycerol kinase family enzyme